MFGMSELDGNPKGRHREHASSLHPRGDRGASDIKRGDEASLLEAKRIPREPQGLDHNGNCVTGVPRDPVVLALDSAGLGCSVVVASGETVLGAESDTAMHGQAEKLFPMVDSVMHRAGLAASALDIIAVTVGPGSFILIALESRREDLYVQLFDHLRVALEDPAATMPTALNERLNDIIGGAPLLVAGDAAQRAASNLSKRPDTVVAAGSAPDAAGVLRAVLCRWPLPAQSAKPAPLYLRPPHVTFSKRGR